MARPRADAGEIPARQRIIEAFWKMLAEGGYEGITVRGLARRAHVSPNTLYYHFACMEDVAKSALDEVIDEELIRAVVGAGTHGGGSMSGEQLARPTAPDAERFARVRLFASSGSGKLANMLIDALRTAWLSVAGIDEAGLTYEQQCDLTFVFGGAVALLGSNLSENPVGLAGMLNRPLGHGIVQTMAGLRTQ